MPTTCREPRPFFQHVPIVLLFCCCSTHALAASPEQVYEKASDSIVFVLASSDTGIVQGSGVVVAPNTVATNCHAVSKASRVTVRIATQSAVAVSIRGDVARDVCVVSVGLAGVRTAQLAPAARLRIGQRVYAIGAPRGLMLSLSEGLVSSLRLDRGG